MQVIDGKTIRNRRRELNMTLEECCDGICSLSYLSMIENGKRPLTIELLEKFTERLGLNELNAHSRFSLEALFTSGVIAVRSGQTGEAEEIVAEMPESNFKEVLRGLILERKGNPQASIATLRPILSSDVEPNLFLLVANSLVRQLFQEGEIESAMEIGEYSLRKAMVQHRPLDDAMIELRGTLANAYTYLGDAKRGLQLTKNELGSQNTKWSQVIEDWSKASLQLRSGDMTGAAVSFRRAYDQMVEFDRPIARARLLRASILARLLSANETELTVRKDLEQVLEVFSMSNLVMDQIETKYVIAIYDLKQGDLESVVKTADEIEPLLSEIVGPKALLLRIVLADLLLDGGFHERGEGILRNVREALQSAGGSRLLALAWSRLASVYEKMGNTDEAYAAIKRSVAIAGFAAAPIANFSLD